MKLLGKLFLGTALLLQFMNAFALEDNRALAKAAQNPFKVNHFAKHIALPFENDTNFGYGRYDDKQNILNFKPVIPFQLSDNFDLVVRTIAPIFERTATPNSQNVIDGHYINGWGDINPTFFLTPARFKHFMWGLGPTIFIPTASNNKYIGTGKYSIGPELGVYTMPDNWMVGFLTYNVWSVAGQQNRQSVNQFSFQYLVSYFFTNGWFITTNPTITSDWQQTAKHRWIVPFGLSAGRTFNAGNQPISLSASGYYNAIRPATVGPKWQLQLEFEWLFERKLASS